MKIWITGGAGSGKSSLAQELASALAAGGPHYYVATMVPRDDEDRRRISRHIDNDITKVSEVRYLVFPDIPLVQVFTFLQ